MSHEDFFKEASPFIRWNPEDDQQDYKITVDEGKFRHVVKRFLLTEEPTIADEISKIFGDTLYKALDFKFMPGINQILLLAGKMTPEEFKNLYMAGFTPRGKYRFFLRKDDAELFIEDVESATKMMWELGGSVTTSSLKEGLTLYPVSGPKEIAIDSLLKDSSNPSWSEILGGFNTLTALQNESAYQMREAKKASKALEKELSSVKAIVSDMKLRALAAPKVEVIASHDGLIPEGKLVMKKASDVFDKNLIATDFEIPTWEWESHNPFVPAVDPHYIFRKKELSRVLLALVTNRRMYLHGHTGSGKTTLLEQVAAKIGYMFSRINFDSEITRPDLIGRDTLVYEEGKQVSKFVDGILPRVMSGPFLACFDEIDFARPDVAYVMQAALEGNALRIMEDGDRIVQPHPYFRMFGTGNTVGQGDEHGLYQGARVQSLAFMNRFGIFTRVEYLNKKEREELVTRVHPDLSVENREMLLNYVTEHLKAFENADITLPISPRGFLGAALSTTITGDLKDALFATFVDSASEEDRATLIGIIDRVVK